MKCSRCGKPYSDEEIEQKRIQKSERISRARKEARLNGELVGRKTLFDREEIIRLSRQGLSIRKIARIIGCSTTPVVDAIKQTKGSNT